MSWLGISVATGAVVFRVTVILLAAASNNWVTADCNADGDVDSTDFNGLAHHFNPRGYGGEGPGQVSERGALGLLLMGAACFFRQWNSVCRPDRICCLSQGEKSPVKTTLGAERFFLHPYHRKIFWRPFSTS